jgi:hypothetical protein
LTEWEYEELVTSTLAKGIATVLNRSAV